ncbi:MAG: tetraacyldisaccharide 4'-kinase [Ignavibacteriaceae bacterium]|nr:tetraacyldisaccharide 4'-kinase [Ignavibacteriaceae bacterium]
MKLLDIVRVLMLPIVPLYGIVVWFRNMLFDLGIFKSTGVKRPVVSVGNLTVGGSGKTPLVIFLAELFKKHKLDPGVVSRGYGRETKGVILVADRSGVIRTAEESGDEIFQTAVECRVPAAVGENRVEAATRLIETTDVGSIILDDAFQHRWIERDANLLIVAQRFLVDENPLRRSLFPTGNLREPFSRAQRADAVIINRKFTEKKEIPQNLLRYMSGKKIFHAYYEPLYFVDIKTDKTYSAKEFTGQKSLCVSGIANPHSFVSALEQLHIDTSNRMIFIDHKAYTEKEVEKVRKLFYSTNAYSVITTQKDAVKFVKLSRELDDIDIYYLKIRLRLDEEQEFEQFILNKIKATKQKTS